MTSRDYEYLSMRPFCVACLKKHRYNYARFVVKNIKRRKVGVCHDHYHMMESGHLKEELLI